MKHYFTYISMTYATRNAFEEKVLALMKQNDRLIIPADELQIFVNDLNEQIGLLHLQHKRCTPIKIKLRDTRLYKDDDQDYAIEWNGFNGFNGHELCHFKILLIENDQKLLRVPVKATIKLCQSCGVPPGYHGNRCGWPNAHRPEDGSVYLKTFIESQNR